MKSDKFFSELNSNFENILFSGLVVNDEIQNEWIQQGMDRDEYEALVMRLFFIANDPDKRINYFINQYEEGKYLYLTKVGEGIWLFVLSANKSFAKLHFFINFMLNDSDLEISNEEVIPVTSENDKMASAKRIQDLLLPNPEKAFSMFSNYHLWYESADLVGGDFYWVKKGNGYTYIVVGDCTGHSVEGALASVSVMSILNQVFESDISPHMLIKNLHRSLNDMQEQKLTDGYGIGCELMAMRFDHKLNQLNYSGTGMGLYHFTNDRLKINKTKKAFLDPERVLKFIRSRRIQLVPGDRIFTHSDGLTDQLNSAGKKFKSTHLIEPIKRDGFVNDDNTKKLIKNYQGNEPQTDDIVSLYLEI